MRHGVGLRVDIMTSPDTRVLLDKSGHADRAHVYAPLSSAQDISRAPQRALTKTRGAVRRSLSTHFDTQRAHGQSQSAEIRSQLAQDRSGFADSLSGFADVRSGHAVDRSRWADFQSHGTKVPSRGTRGRSLCAKVRSSSARVRSQCAETRSGDAQLRSRTTHTDNEDSRDGFCRLLPPLAAASPRDRESSDVSCAVSAARGSVAASLRTRRSVWS